jgi:hypothetical protein
MARSMSLRPTRRMLALWEPGRQRPDRSLWMAFSAPTGLPLPSRTGTAARAGGTSRPTTVRHDHQVQPRLFEVTTSSDSEVWAAPGALSRARGGGPAGRAPRHWRTGCGVPTRTTVPPTTVEPTGVIGHSRGPATMTVAHWLFRRRAPRTAWPRAGRTDNARPRILSERPGYADGR